MSEQFYQVLEAAGPYDYYSVRGYAFGTAENISKVFCDAGRKRIRVFPFDILNGTGYIPTLSFVDLYCDAPIFVQSNDPEYVINATILHKVKHQKNQHMRNDDYNISNVKTVKVTRIDQDTAMRMLQEARDHEKQVGDLQIQVEELRAKIETLKNEWQAKLDDTTSRKGDAIGPTTPDIQRDSYGMW